MSQEENDEESVDVGERSAKYFQLYDFHIRQSKEVYREISLEYDCSNNRGIEDLAKLIKYK